MFRLKTITEMEDKNNLTFYDLFYTFGILLVNLKTQCYSGLL